MEVPRNLHLVWHKGSKAFCEINSRPIKDGYPHGIHRVEEWREAIPPATLSEELYRLLFFKAITLASSHPTNEYMWIRYDHESQPETDNNRPFIMDTSPRYFNGAENKTIRYEGYEFTSQLGTIFKYDEEYMRRAQREEKKEVKKERKAKRKR